MASSPTMQRVDEMEEKERKSHRQEVELLGTLDAGTMSHIVTGVDTAAWALSPGYYAPWRRPCKRIDTGLITPHVSPN